MTSKTERNLPLRKPRKRGGLSPKQRRSWLAARAKKIIELRQELAAAQCALAVSAADVHRLRGIANANRSDCYKLLHVLLLKLSDTGVFIRGRVDRAILSLGVLGVATIQDLEKLDSRQWVELARRVSTAASQLEDDFFRRASKPLSTADARALAQLVS